MRYLSQEVEEVLSDHSEWAESTPLCGCYGEIKKLERALDSSVLGHWFYEGTWID